MGAMMYGLMAVGAGFSLQSSPELLDVWAATYCDRQWSYFMMTKKKIHWTVSIYKLMAGEMESPVQ